MEKTSENFHRDPGIELTPAWPEPTSLNDWSGKQKTEKCIHNRLKPGACPKRASFLYRTATHRQTKEGTKPQKRTSSITKNPPAQYHTQHQDLDRAQSPTGRTDQSPPNGQGQISASGPSPAAPRRRLAFVSAVLMKRSTLSCPPRVLAHDVNTQISTGPYLRTNTEADIELAASSTRTRSSSRRHHFTTNQRTPRDGHRPPRRTHNTEI